MIEFSIGELICFSVAVIAVSKWFYWKGEAHRHLTIVRAIIEDKEIRDKMVNDFDKWKKEQRA